MWLVVIASDERRAEANPFFMSARRVKRSGEGSCPVRARSQARVERYIQYAQKGASNIQGTIAKHCQSGTVVQSWSCGTRSSLRRCSMCVKYYAGAIHVRYSWMYRSRSFGRHASLQFRLAQREAPTVIVCVHAPHLALLLLRTADIQKTFRVFRPLRYQARPVRRNFRSLACCNPSSST